MRGQLLDYISQASELTFCVRVIINGMEKGGEDLFFIFMAVLIDI